MRSGLMKLLSIMGGTLVSLPDAGWAQSSSDTERYVWGPHMMWWEGGWYAMIFGPLFMIVFLAVLIAAVALLARWLGGPWHGPAPAHHTPQSRTSLDILKERFARGEIDKDEFEERRRVLGE